jgi:hypothetical protein
MKRKSSNELDGVLKSLICVPLLLGGVAAAVAASRGPLGRKLRKLLGGPSASAGPEGQAAWGTAQQLAAEDCRNSPRSLALLRQAIIGNDKHAVVAVFGPPPTTGGYNAPPEPELKLPDYFRADTWYYLLDKVNRCAMAIQFEGGVASEAQFLEPPRHVR